MDEILQRRNPLQPKTPESRIERERESRKGRRHYGSRQYTDVSKSARLFFSRPVPAMGSQQLL